MKRFLLTALLLLAPLPVQAASLYRPATTLGNVMLTPDTSPYLQLWTVAKSQSASVLGGAINTNLSAYGTQGSLAMFKIQPGTYDLTWQLETMETAGKDRFLIWDGTQISQMINSRIATIRYGGKQISLWQTSRIETTTGNVALTVMDTKDRAGITFLKIFRFRKVPESGAIVGVLLVGVLMVGRRKCVGSVKQ
ncbi:PEP-CTERM sorting domain-containing protein [Phormidesmis sp. 146-33]